MFIVLKKPIYEGPFTIGVHKKNVSPQNHSQNIALNDHYIYKIIYLVDFFFIGYSHTS
jgi:hypothetical protein